MFSVVLDQLILINQVSYLAVIVVVDPSVSSLRTQKGESPVIVEELMKYPGILLEFH